MDRLRALQIAPEAPGLPKLAWCDELAQVSEIDGVQVTLCGGRQATRSAIGARLARAVGRGAVGRARRAGPADGGGRAGAAEWLACMMRQARRAW